MQRLKSLLPDVLAILFFVALSFAYFAGPVRDGLVLTGHDHSGGMGAVSEMEAYKAQHGGERTRWTNTLFSGMPTYQMAPSYKSTDTLAKIESVYKLGLPDYVVLVFIMLLGFYIMLRAFDFRAWMAALGAVLWAFSSYYFIIIGAGHIWKFYTLAFIPPTIAGMALCYRGKYLWGFILSALFMGLQILSNHVQMSYYFISVLVLMALAWLVDAFRRKEVLAWVKASAMFAVGCLIGVLMNISNLYHTWSYSKESMRSKSELTQKNKNAADQTSSGLERSYITAWSYGIGETWTLMVPNTKGGASQPLTKNKTAMEKADATYTPVYQSLGQYWGEQPGTSGPVYVGAFVCFLFILSLFIVKGPMKWALLAATILSILLSWGKNFMPFTDFFLDYVPMYDKFRTVASILVVAEFTIPLLAMMGLKQLIEMREGDYEGQDKAADRQGANPKSSRFTLQSAFLCSFLLTGGLCLLFSMMPDVFFGNYISSQESAMLTQAAQAGYIPQEMLAPIMQNLMDMRRAVFSADALRSFWVIMVGVLVLIAYYFKKIKVVPMVLCLIVLCVADMWDVNKRYLSDDMFSAPQPAQTFFQKTPADEAILQDSDLYYRVLDMTVSTFNDNTASYWHKSIGGYHAAKLRRYQELIEAHIMPEMMAFQQAAASTGGKLDSIAADSLFPVLNMLNMKYALLPLQSGEKVPVKNPHAMGNAWFVNGLLEVATADDELMALDKTDLRRKAVVRTEDANELKASVSQTATDTTGIAGAITLTTYEANALTFEANSEKGGIAVFSDIFYPGWTCTIDGQPVTIHRADYVLRALAIPAGKHKIGFLFDPQSVHTTETIAYIALALLIAAILFGIVRFILQLRHKNS